ncbi:MAG TPA: competence/damage-inducible protein A [Phycisphaerae bacterium]|nr:competence/damage-inducible protein A [Phycisphaerae bacterium]
MNCVIISTGDELVWGLTVNTNASWLSGQLAQMGITCKAHITVGDDRKILAEAIIRACGECELVLITGGLGPTEDDLTRLSLADALSETLVEDAKAVTWIESFFRKLNRPMPASNRLQALRPASAQCVENSAGTAPGLIAKKGATSIYAMPGVPREMKAMFEKSFAPLLACQCSGIITRILKLNTFGAGESWIGEKIADLMQRDTNPRIGTTVHEGVVSVRIYATGSPDETEKMVLEARRQIQERLGALIFSKDQATLEQVLAIMLTESGQTVATAESCTGGLLAELLTNVPGSSKYFLRGWVTYSNAAKEEDLGVAPELINQHGAVSEQVAAAMAKMARQHAKSDWGIGITGIAGPDGGTAEKPVGLVFIAVAGAQETYVRRCQFPGDRADVRGRAALMALTLLRFKMLGLNPDAVLP